MDGISQWVFTATLDYENALIDALAALDDVDEGGRLEACMRIAEALAPLKMMSKLDREDALRCLLRRGRVPEDAWDRIDAAMQSLTSQQPAH